MSRNLNFEAKLRKELHLNENLIEVLSEERTGSTHEIKTLASLKKEIGNRIYVEAVYLLTHKFIENSSDARKIFKEILIHRKNMAKILDRNVSIQVAALDYMQNIRNILKKPTIIESDQYREFTDKAIIDETTSTYDKNLLQSDLESEIEKSQRLGIPFSILFIDLDNLKQINDTYGHEIGTRVLKLVSSCIRQNLRRYDSVYRYGGDEFLVILPGDNCSQAYKTAQRIMDLLHSPVTDIPLTPTISIGIACFDNQIIKDQKTLFNSADKALYAAKQKGKNMVQVFGDTLHKQRQQLSSSVPVQSVIIGIPVAPGVGIGRADILSRQEEYRDLFGHEIPNEIERFFNALEQVKRSLINGQKTKNEKIIFNEKIMPGAMLEKSESKYLD